MKFEVRKLIETREMIEIKDGTHFRFNTKWSNEDVWVAVFTDRNFLVKESENSDEYVVHELEFAKENFQNGTWIVCQ